MASASVCPCRSPFPQLLRLLRWLISHQLRPTRLRPQPIQLQRRPTAHQLRPMLLPRWSIPPLRFALPRLSTRRPLPCTSGTVLRGTGQLMPTDGQPMVIIMVGGTTIMVGTTNLIWFLIPLRLCSRNASSGCFCTVRPQAPSFKNLHAFKYFTILAKSLSVTPGKRRTSMLSSRSASFTRLASGLLADLLTNASYSSPSLFVTQSNASNTAGGNPA